MNTWVCWLWLRSGCCLVILRLLQECYSRNLNFTSMSKGARLIGSKDLGWGGGTEASAKRRGLTEKASGKIQSVFWHWEQRPWKWGKRSLCPCQGPDLRCSHGPHLFLSPYSGWLASLKACLPPSQISAPGFVTLGVGVKSFQPRHNIRAATVP